MQTISKREILNLIKQYNINEASKKECLDGSIEVNIKFGIQVMNKQPTIRELILSIVNDVKEIKVRLDHVEEQQKEMKNDIQIMKSDIQQIKNCPTIKKELTV